MRKNIGDAARVIYRAAFNGEVMPKGYKVYFVDRITDWRYGGKRYDRVGQHNPRRREIEVIRTRCNWLDTLIHEFVHQRCPGLRHGKEFDALVSAAYRRVFD